MASYVGVDSGSSSVKFALIDDSKKVINTLYLKNLGLINTIKAGLRQFKDMIPKDAVIKGCGVTGSGKDLTGILVGADYAPTEITAHAIGAVTFVPNVRTIFEIGGEDSKLLVIEDGILSDFAMNTLCLTEDTNITVNHFIQKQIKDIMEGDKVLTHKGDFKEVKGVYKREYNGEMISLTTSNMRRLNITPEHPILVLKRNDIKCYVDHVRENIPVCRPYKKNSEWCKKHRCKKNISFEPKFVEAKKLEKGDLIAIPLPTEIKNVDHFDFGKIKELNQRQILKEVQKFYFKDDLLRLLGYYLAEGSLLYCKSRGKSKKKCLVGIQFVFNINEGDYINDVVSTLNNNFDVSITIDKKPERHTCNIWVYNKSLAQVIRYLCAAESHKKVICRELMFLSPKLQLEIVKGVFRGDGAFRNKARNKKATRSFTLTTVSEQLAHQIQWLLLRNKIKCSFYKAKKKTKGEHTIYNVEIVGLEINKLNDDLFYIDGKEVKKIHSPSFFYSNWLFVPIKKIVKQNYQGHVYNLEVDKNNSYIANSLSVHNCSAGTGAMIETIAKRLGVEIEDVSDLALQSKQNIRLAGKCSVFCQSDCVGKRNTGCSTEDILMGVCRALIRNYLALLAKNKELKGPFCFQGATSRNKGLVKAFEEIIKEKVIIPPYAECLGAIGAAILTKKRINGETKFKGFEVGDMKAEVINYSCSGCNNNCEIPKILQDGKLIGYGYAGRCGKWVI